MEGVDLLLLEPAHAKAVFLATDRNREYLRQWLPWVDRSLTVRDTAKHIRETFRLYLKDEGLAAGIWVEGELAGAISIHKIDAANRQASVGYWLDASCQGRGIMTAACRSIVNRAFSEYKLHRVEIRCATGNQRSCAIPRRLGFRREGVVREAEWLNDHFVDLVVWGMLEDEWNPTRG